MGKEENRRLVEDKKESESESCSVFSDSLPPRGLYSPWNSPGQNTGVGSLSLLQGIFSTQRSNPGLPHCRRILYQLSHQGSPRILKWVASAFCRGFSQPRNGTRVSCIAGGFFTSWATQGSPVRGGQDRQARSHSYGEGNIANNSAWYHRMIVWCFLKKYFSFLLYFSYFYKKIWNASRICVSSLDTGHANLLCIVPILVYVLPKRTVVWCFDGSEPENI